MTSKKFIFIIIGILISASLVLGIFISKPASDISENPEFGKYISAYTYGVISKTSSIKIQLNDDFAKTIKSENINSEKLFDFDPSINGKISIYDNIIEFVPNENLPSNTKFFVEFNLDELSDSIPDEFSKFSFEIQTIRQNFEIIVDEHITTDKKTLKWQKALAHVQTADVEELDNIKKIISDINDTEILCKKNPHISSSILLNFFMGICKKANSFS